ncbi:hypothetical protein VTN02DRAFT_5604 [Thermoascus thermophilus]
MTVSSRRNGYAAGRPIVLGLARVLVLLLSRLPLIAAVPTSFASHDLLRTTEKVEEPRPVTDPGFWLNIGIATALVLTGGAFAGLTIALMGQDEIYLQVIKTSGEAAERKNAASVLKLLQKGKHWVLVTLLLSNVITNETLPIILDRTLGGGWPAVVGSTVLIVIFGEIVPQSICVRYGLPIGAWMAPCVLVLMYIMAPVAWPVAKLLDKLLGEDHGTVYKKAGLKTLVTLHKTLGSAGEQLNSDEVTIISAVLDLKEKPVGSIMTPMEDVFTMSADTVLDEETMDLILSQGYSRIPIYAPDNPENFVGMLLVKMLITYDPEDCKRVRDFALATLPETRPETSCLDIVNFFQEGKSHMVMVSEYPGEDHGALGVVTLEDVIEELIGEEIIDESDVFVDVHKAIRRLTPAPKYRVPKGRIVEEPPAVPSGAQEGNLIDTGDEQAKSPKQDGAAETQRQSSVGPPQPRFLLRRQTGDTNAPETITKVGATDEIREHLKHLGPSNLASRPRQTRYQNVKIKRGGMSPPAPGESRLQGPSEEHLQAPASGYQGGIGAGLLKSAGMDAKDGVHALQVGYGTIGDHATYSVHGSATKGTHQPEHLPKLTIPEAENEDEADDAHRPASSHRSRPSSARSTDALGDHLLASYRAHGPTRSGSITEQVVDVNGVRKVVLQTTSSSSSDTETQKSHHNTPRHDQSHASEEGTRGSKDSPAKKRRRRRKKNSGSKPSDGGDGERQPLMK